MRNRKGFTLIELLIVIAIILILAAILFPVYSKAKESARSVKCLNNVKMLAMAFQMYLTDNDDVLPVMDKVWATKIADQGDAWGCKFSLFDKLSTTLGGGGGAGLVAYAKSASIFGDLMPYVKDPKVWNCPTYKKMNTQCAGDPDTQFAMQKNDYYSFYNYNNRLVNTFCMGYKMNSIPMPEAVRAAWSIANAPQTGANTSWGEGGRAWDVGEFPKPSQVVLFQEHLAIHDYRTSGVIALTGSIGTQFGARMNFSFMDGHAATLPIGTVIWSASSTFTSWPFYVNDPLSEYAMPWCARHPASCINRANVTECFMWGWDTD